MLMRMRVGRHGCTGRSRAIELILIWSVALRRVVRFPIRFGQFFVTETISLVVARYQKPLLLL